MLIGMACVVYGQTDGVLPAPAYFFGLYGGFGFGFEVADLQLPCGSFYRGSSTGWEAGGLFEFPLGGRLALQLRGSAARQTGSLIEPLLVPRGVDGPVLVDQVFEYERTTAGFAGLLRLPLVGRLHVQGGAGVRHTVAGFQRQKLVMVSPEDLLFSGINSRELGIDSGEVARDVPLVAVLEAGLAYDLPISETSTLSPEIVGSFPLTSQTSDGSWRTPSLRFGASLRFGRRPDIPPIAERFPVVAESAYVTPRLISSVTTNPRVVSVRISEYDSTEVLPLLNQIFFAESSDLIRPEYRQLAKGAPGGFSNAELIGSALDVYYHVLNIVGMRMRESDATLTINGYRNGRENDPGLSRRRAEAVRNYLRDVWNIPARRLKVSGKGLPPDPAREATQEGYEENARVELIPSDPNILGPIFRRHIQRVATPSAITFHMDVVADAGVKSWQLAIDEEGDGRFRTFEGTGFPPDSVTWNWRSSEGELPKLPMQLRYTFTVTEPSGRVMATEPKGIDVAYQSVQEKLLHQVRDTTIENFSLLLFTYDSPEVSQSDNDLLTAIAAGVGPGASVRFTGYTDSLGDERHNRELATARAREAAAIFRELVPRDVTITVNEDGGEWERFPFTTPEGRSQCRTVVIEVRTPKGGDEDGGGRGR